MSVDPITGLPSGDDSSQETISSIPQRSSVPSIPQSPLVRGTHLDKSVDRSRKRPNSINQSDNDNAQFPAKSGELHGFIPPVYGVVHIRERLDHIVDVVQCVVDGREEFVSEQELLLNHPPNLEKTRFSMSKKKLKLPFVDDMLDRFDDYRWLYPDQFDRRRKLWHKSVARSLKFINKFLEKELLSGGNGPPQDYNDPLGNTTVGSCGTNVAISKKSDRGRPKTKTVSHDSTAPKKRGRKAKESVEEDGLATVSKLTLPAPAEKIPKRSATKGKEQEVLSGASKKPTFGRRKKDLGETVMSDRNAEVKQTKNKGKKKLADNEDCEATSPKKSRKENVEGKKSYVKKAEADPSSAKKPAFGASKRGKKGSTREANVAVELHKPAEDGDGAKSEIAVVMEEDVTELVKDKCQSEKGNDERLEVFEKMDDEEEATTMAIQTTASQSISIPLIPSSIHDGGMETDDEDWEPNDTPREMTPPRGLLHTSQDYNLFSSTSASHLPQSSQSLFGSVSSSLIGSPNTSFSSQASSLLTPSMNPSISLSSSLLPSQPLASSTQIPMVDSQLKHDESEKKEKKAISSGPRVRPTFGKRK